ncbi:hypothetical protein VFPBJ_02271 [Purpureocillium lilacinum]|nr:hypothetical protein VFPBJ_02271 [Purpureocillium lilacinum]
MSPAPPTPANPPGIPAIKDPGTLLPSAFDSRAAEGMISHRTHHAGASPTQSQVIYPGHAACQKSDCQVRQ